MRTIDVNASKRPQRKRPTLTRHESAKLTTTGDANTLQRFPKMSLAALAFARRMQASPHMQATIRDLADK